MQMLDPCVRKYRALSALKVRDNFLDYFKLSKDDVMGFYWPKENEITPLSIVKEVSCDLALPKYDFFARWEKGDPLVSSDRFGLQPAGNEKTTPMTLLLPIKQFDRFGFAVEAREGFYNTFLKTGQQIIRTIGLAFASEEVDNLSKKTHDIPLDYIITEKEIIRCGFSS